MPSDLVQKRCTPCRPGSGSLSAAQIQKLLPEVPDWANQNNQLVRTFNFKDFHQTMEFVNAVAWVAHREDHHPDMKVGYNRCEISYSTHSVGGLSENDFICAAKVNALVA